MVSKVWKREDATVAAASAAGAAAPGPSSTSSSLPPHAQAHRPHAYGSGRGGLDAAAPPFAPGGRGRGGRGRGPGPGRGPHAPHADGHRAHAVAAAAGGASTSGGVQANGQPPAKKSKLSLDNTASNVAARLEEKTREVEALRRALQEREAVLLKKKQEADAKEAARLAAEAAQRELQRKRQHLNKGFSSVAPPAAAAPAPAPPPAGPSSSGGGGGDGADAPEAVAAARGADTAEVARVLGAPNDYEVLRLHVGAPLSTVRKAYRALAVSLHPDKCSTEGAGDAFQRVQAAYTALVKNLGG